MIEFDANTILALVPVAGLALLAMAMIVLDIARPHSDTLLTGFAAVGLIVLMALVVIVGPVDLGSFTLGLLTSPQEVFGGAYVRDGLTALLDLLLLSIALLTLLAGPDYLRPRGLPAAEFSAMLFFAITGAMLIAGSRDLLLLFLALELLVLPGYLLAGYAKRDGLSTEGAIKYFLLGSFSSAIFLFGLVLTFGYTGTTSIPGVAAAIGQALGSGSVTSLAPALLMGLALLTTGAAFKIAAVPFHYWTPDAYQGSPTPVTGYLSVGPKVAAFALILRLFVEALGPVKADWTPFVVVLAAATMTLGNLVALSQDNIKRMLAYSSIAHTGYILVGLAAFGAAPSGSPAEAAGLQSVLFYSVAYSFMNLVRFRRGRGAPAPAGCDQPDRLLRRARRALAAACLADAAVHAEPHRHPTTGRLLGQVVRHPGRAAGRRLAQPARGAGRAQCSRRGLLLPARGGLHVHAPAARARTRSEHRHAQPARPGGSRPGDAAHLGAAFHHVRHLARRPGGAGSVVGI